MNSHNSTSSSPTFRNLKSKHSHSPVELKEKMRKNYKDKVQNCRNMLLNRFRGPVAETYLRDTLIDIYKSMFNFSNAHIIHNEETEVLEEIKNELVQEEVDWWLREYEKSQMENIDWSSMEKNDNVICPVCQKNNFSLQHNILSCSNCKIEIRTHKSLIDIKQSIVNSVEKHSSVCNNDIIFTILPEIKEAHIYLICESCMEMQSVV